MFLQSGGNVGIATNSPNARLSIQANSSNEGMELLTPSSGSFQFGVHNVGGASGTAIEFRRGGSDGFDTLSAIIDASGNLGIGTCAPTHKLSVTDTSGIVARFVGCNGYNYDIESQGDGTLWDQPRIVTGKQ